MSKKITENNNLRNHMGVALSKKKKKINLLTAATGAGKTRAATDIIPNLLIIEENKNNIYAGIFAVSQKINLKPNRKNDNVPYFPVVAESEYSNIDNKAWFIEQIADIKTINTPLIQKIVNKDLNLKKEDLEFFHSVKFKYKTDENGNNTDIKFEKDYDKLKIEDVLKSSMFVKLELILKSYDAMFSKNSPLKPYVQLGVYSDKADAKITSISDLAKYINITKAEFTKILQLKNDLKKENIEYREKINKTDELSDVSINVKSLMTLIVSSFNNLYIELNKDFDAISDIKNIYFEGDEKEGSHKGIKKVEKNDSEDNKKENNIFKIDFLPVNIINIFHNKKFNKKIIDFFEPLVDLFNLCYPFANCDTQSAYYFLTHDKLTTKQSISSNEAGTIYEILGNTKEDKKQAYFIDEGDKQYSVYLSKPSDLFRISNQLPNADKYIDYIKNDYISSSFFNIKVFEFKYTNNLNQKKIKRKTFSTHNILIIDEAPEFFNILNQEQKILEKSETIPSICIGYKNLYQTNYEYLHKKVKKYYQTIISELDPSSKITLEQIIDMFNSEFRHFSSSKEDYEAINEILKTIFITGSIKNKITINSEKLKKVIFKNIKNNVRLIYKNNPSDDEITFFHFISFIISFIIVVIELDIEDDFVKRIKNDVGVKHAVNDAIDKFAKDIRSKSENIKQSLENSMSNIYINQNNEILETLIDTFITKLFFKIIPIENKWDLKDIDYFMFSHESSSVFYKIEITEKGYSPEYILSAFVCNNNKNEVILMSATTDIHTDYTYDFITKYFKDFIDIPKKTIKPHNLFKLEVSANDKKRNYKKYNLIDKNNHIHQTIVNYTTPLIDITYGNCDQIIVDKTINNKYYETLGDVIEDINDYIKSMRNIKIQWDINSSKMVKDANVYLKNFITKYKDIEHLEIDKYVEQLLSKELNKTANGKVKDFTKKHKLTNNLFMIEQFCNGILNEINNHKLGGKKDGLFLFAQNSKDYQDLLNHIYSLSTDKYSIFNIDDKHNKTKPNYHNNTGKTNIPLNANNKTNTNQSILLVKSYFSFNENEDIDIFNKKYKKINYGYITLSIPNRDDLTINLICFNSALNTNHPDIIRDYLNIDKNTAPFILTTEGSAGIGVNLYITENNDTRDIANLSVLINFYTQFSDLSVSKDLQDKFRKGTTLNFNKSKNDKFHRIEDCFDYRNEIEKYLSFDRKIHSFLDTLQLLGRAERCQVDNFNTNITISHKNKERLIDEYTSLKKFLKIASKKVKNKFEIDLNNSSQRVKYFSAHTISLFNFLENEIKSSELSVRNQIKNFISDVGNFSDRIEKLYYPYLLSKRSSKNTDPLIRIKEQVEACKIMKAFNSHNSLDANQLKTYIKRIVNLIQKAKCLDFDIENQNTSKDDFIKCVNSLIYEKEDADKGISLYIKPTLNIYSKNTYSKNHLTHICSDNKDEYLYKPFSRLINDKVCEMVNVMDVIKSLEESIKSENKNIIEIEKDILKKEKIFQINPDDDENFRDLEDLESNLVKIKTNLEDYKMIKQINQQNKEICYKNLNNYEKIQLNLIDINNQYFVAPYLENKITGNLGEHFFDFYLSDKTIGILQYLQNNNINLDTIDTLENDPDNTPLVNCKIDELGQCSSLFSKKEEDFYNFYGYELFEKYDYYLSQIENGKTTMICIDTKTFSSINYKHQQDLIKIAESKFESVKKHFENINPEINVRIIYINLNTEREHAPITNINGIFYANLFKNYKHVVLSGEDNKKQILKIVEIKSTPLDKEELLKLLKGDIK